MDGPRCSPEELVERLRRSLPEPSPERFVALYAARLKKSLFSIMVGVVLSQNTNDKNAIEAYRRLLEVIGGNLTPEAVLRLDRKKLEEAVKPAGMYRRRVDAILAIAKWLSEHPEIEREICSMDPEEARRLLMKLPGVGPKTADVVLMNYCGFPLFPVDTHISRILERWGVKGGYEEKRRWGERFFPPELRREAHMLLIELGRRYCRPGRPRCDECPLRDCCPAAHAMEAGASGSSTVGDRGEGGRREARKGDR